MTPFQTIEFLLAVVGATSLSVVLFSDLVDHLKDSGRREVAIKIDKKPLNCPMCMGFWISISAYPFLCESFSTVEMLKLGFMGAAGSWAFFRSVTGQY